MLISEAKDELEKEALRVTSVDFNIAENSVAHHTDKYELTEQHRYERGQRVTPQLVVRRGQPFDIKITFDRAYSREKDELKLVFNLGKNDDDDDDDNCDDNNNNY